MSERRLVLGLARREALERARSSAYRASTAILLVATVAAVALPSLFAGDDVRTVGVVGTDDAPLAAALAATTPDETTIEVEAFADREAGETALAEDLDVLVVDGEELVWERRPDPELAALVTTAVGQLDLQERAGGLGLADEDLQQLLAGVQLRTTLLESDQQEVEQRVPQVVIATAGMVLLFVSITFYGSFILMSVVEEKQNRVVEVLLAHVDPRDLLAAKVLGHGALGLGQMLAIGAVAAIGIAVTDPIDIPALNAYGAIAGTIMWFVLGYATYSILYGALGSLASRTEDAQSAVGPLTILLMIAYFATFTTLGNPDSLLLRIGSFLPPTAPMMMPVRTALTEVAAWEIVVAVLLQLATIVGLVRLGGRLYKGAVLRIGRKLSLRETWAATS